MKQRLTDYIQFLPDASGYDPYWNYGGDYHVALNYRKSLNIYSKRRELSAVIALPARVRWFLPRSRDTPKSLISNLLTL